MAKLKMNLGDLVEDTHKVFRDSAYTAGFVLSYLGLEYIDQHFFGSSITPNLPPDTKLFSLECALYVSQAVCTFGTIIKGCSTAYNTLKIPAKLLTGKYFKKKH